MDRDAIIREILSLSAEDRTHVADVISASLAADLPPQLSPNDLRGVLRRLEAFDAHPETFLSWEQVKSRLAEQRGAPVNHTSSRCGSDDSA